MNQISGLSSDHLIQSATLSPGTLDPLIQAMKINSGNWNFNYNGKDAQGNIIANGSYILEIDSSQGGSKVTLRYAFTVLDQPLPQLSAIVAPNPVGPEANFVIFNWTPSQPVEFQIYDSSGGLVRKFEAGFSSPLRWDLRTSSGHLISDGFYLVVVREPGQRSVKVLKLAVMR